MKVAPGLPLNTVDQFYSGNKIILLFHFKGSHRLCFTKLIDFRGVLSRLCMDRTTKTDHYWKSKDGSLLLEALKGEWERKKAGGQVYGSSGEKLKGIINRASLALPSLTLQIGLYLSSSWVWNDKAVCVKWEARWGERGRRAFTSQLSHQATNTLTMPQAKALCLIESSMTCVKTANKEQIITAN